MGCANVAEQAQRVNTKSIQTLVETFEIATDKGTFEIYSTNRFKRAGNHSAGTR